MAGYSPKQRTQSVSRALKSEAVIEKITDLMNKHPVLTDEGLAQKMAEGIQAEKTEFFTHEAVVGEEPIIGDNGEPVLDKKTGKPRCGRFAI